MPSRPSDGRCPQDGHRGSVSGHLCLHRELEGSVSGQGEMGVRGKKESSFRFFGWVSCYMNLNAAILMFLHRNQNDAKDSN